MPNKSRNAGKAKQLTYHEFAARHPSEISEALDLLGYSDARLSGTTSLTQIGAQLSRPPLPLAMEELKKTSFFRLLTAAGRENCPDAFNFLAYAWIRRMDIRIPVGVFVEPRGTPGRPRKTSSYYDTWLGIGSPPLHETKLAVAMFGESFKGVDKAERERMVDRCRKAIIRHQKRLGQNPSG